MRTAMRNIFEPFWHLMHHCIKAGGVTMFQMRTTVTLDRDTRVLVERTMRERGLSFKQAVNEAIRAGLAPGSSAQHAYTTARKLGPARLDLTKALRLAAELEDDALSRRLTESR